MVEPLVIPFVVVVRDELADGATPRALADQDQALEAGCLDGAHEARRVGVQVRRAGGASDGGDIGRGERVAPGRPEARVAVMDEDPDVSQASVLGLGGVPHELGDPRPVGLGADARDLTAAAGQVNQAQHGEAGQAAWRPDRDREAVGGGEHVSVGRETLPPGRARLAVGGGFSAARLAHVGEGAPRDLMPEVAAGTPTPGVAPRAVLGGHPDDEPADRVHAPWAARSATAAAGVCPRDQLSMPAEEGIGRDQGVPVTAYPSPEARGLGGPAPALGVGEPEPARTALLSEDAMLFLERVNDVTRLLVDPARDGHDEELKHVGNRRHTGRAEQRLSAVTNVATRRASSVESARRTASIGFLDSTTLTLVSNAGAHTIPDSYLHGDIYEGEIEDVVRVPSQPATDERSLVRRVIVLAPAVGVMVGTADLDA